MAHSIRSSRFRRRPSVLEWKRSLRVSGREFIWHTYGCSKIRLESFLVALGRVHPTEDTICSRMLVIRITNPEIKTYDTNISHDPDDKGCKFSEQVFRGQIYAIAWPTMWRWDSSEFQRLRRRNMAPTLQLRLSIKRYVPFRGNSMAWKDGPCEIWRRRSTIIRSCSEINR